MFASFSDHETIGMCRIFQKLNTGGFRTYPDAGNSNGRIFRCVQGQISRTLSITNLQEISVVSKPHFAMDPNGSQEPFAFDDDERVETRHFRQRLNSLVDEWDRIFPDTFLSRIPYDDVRVYEERLTYAKEIFLYPIVEGLKAIADHYERNPDKCSLPNISLSLFETLLAREYLWRLFFYGVTGVLIETPPGFDPKHFLAGRGEMPISSLFRGYYFEYKLAGG